ATSQIGLILAAHIRKEVARGTTDADERQASLPVVPCRDRLRRFAAVTRPEQVFSDDPPLDKARTVCREQGRHASVGVEFRRASQPSQQPLAAHATAHVGERGARRRITHPWEGTAMTSCATQAADHLASPCSQLVVTQRSWHFRRHMLEYPGGYRLARERGTFPAQLQPGWHTGPRPGLNSPP